MKDTLFTVWPRLALFYVPCDHTQVSNHLFQANSEILTYAQHRLQGRSDTSHRLVLGTWGLYTYRHHPRRRRGHADLPIYGQAGSGIQRTVAGTTGVVWAALTHLTLANTIPSTS